MYPADLSPLTAIRLHRPGVAGGQVSRLGARWEGAVATRAWWARGDSNSHGLRHMILNHACLPIPPRAHTAATTATTANDTYHYQIILAGRCLPLVVAGVEAPPWGMRRFPHPASRFPSPNWWAGEDSNLRPWD